MRENPKTQDSTCVLPCFPHFPQSRIWSYGRYTHPGIRVRPKTRHTYMFAKKIDLSKTAAWNSKYDLSQKLRYGLNILILVRYDIILHI